MSNIEWLDVAATAEWNNCSTKTIRRIKNGTLLAQTEKIDSRDGRRVLKTVIRVCDLDDAFGQMAHEVQVRRIRASVRSLHVEQEGQDL